MTTNDTFHKMIFDRWYALIQNCDDLLSSLTDGQLEQEVATGKNRGIYLLGHLIAVHDDMLRLLDMGDKQHPELYETFIKSPDKAVATLPTPMTLRTYWKEQCDYLKKQFEVLSAAAWFEKHTAVSQEEFSKEPHRNKLNIILTRSTHLAYHIGQLVLLKQKNPS